MIFDITTENYNKATKNLQNAGFKIDTVPLEFGKLQINQKIKTTSSGEDLNSNAKEIERASLTVELPLPNFGKKLDDYASVMLWFNSPDGYMSYSLPFNMYETPEDITNPSEEQTKHINYKVYDGSCGNFIFKASVTNDDYSYFDLLADSDCYLMFLSTENLEFDYKRTVVVDSVQYFFNLCTAEDTKDYANVIFAEKTNLIAVNYDGTEQIAHCYKLSVCETNNASSEIAYDIKTLTYSQKGCAFKATTLPTLGKGYTVGQFGAIGYTQAELNNLTDEEKAEVSAKNVAALNSAADMCAQMGKEHCKVIELSFEPNLIYLLSSAIYFSSDTKFIGNNAIIRLYKNNDNINDVIVAFSNKRIIDTSDDYGNVGFYDLIVEGRYGSSTSREDQAVKCEGNDYRTIPKNVRFCNCKFVDFDYGVHINNNKYYDVPLYWTITNCEFKTGMGFNLKGVNNLRLLNSHIDNCLSSGKGEHCIYVSEKCSYITVDRCLLENSAGGAIHEFYDSEAAVPTDGFNLNNVYKNIIIRSCLTGLDIGLTSKNTVIENVTMFDVTRGIKLHSCENVTIKNVYATGAFCQNTKSFASGNDRTYNLYKNELGEWCVGDYYAVSIIGTARAHIINCHFNFVSPFISISQYSIGERDSLFKNYSNLFKDGFSESNIIFDNCVFESSSYLLLYKSSQPSNNVIERGSFENFKFVITNQNNEITVVQKHSLSFKRCQFRLSFETVKHTIFPFVSSKDFSSNYVFDSCKVMLFIQNIAAQNEISFTGPYFASADNRASVTIKDTVFYNNCKIHRIEKDDSQIHKYDSPYFECLSDTAVGILSNNSSEDYIKLS